MTQMIDRRVRLRSAANFRDLGGLAVDGGTFATGQVYRSATLSDLSDEDLPTFESLGISRVYDLRTEGERIAKPDRVPAMTLVKSLDVLADGNTSLAAAYGNLRTQPEVVNDLLITGKFKEMLADSYRDFVRLPSATTSYRTLFLDIADQQHEGATLFHCAVGKDRTGWFAASLLMLLGANEDTILSDYLQTNDDLLPALAPLIAEAAELGIDAEALQDVMSVDHTLLDAALDEVDQQFGSIENYFTRGLNLDTATIDALRTKLVA